MERTSRKRIELSLILAAGLSFALINLGVGAPSLPPIWNEVSLDDEAETWGVLRILSEIHLDDRSSYQVEEWLDGPHRRFRLEVLPLHEEHDGDKQRASQTTATRSPPKILYSKRTFLIDGPNSERFFFEPFQCFNMNKFERSANKTTSDFIEREAKLGQLFRYFPAGSKARGSILMGGLGSIWMTALSSKAPIKFRRAKSRSRTIEGRRRGKSRAEVMRSFNKFTVEPSDSFAYQIEFYFLDRAGNNSTEPVDLDAKDLIAVHLIDPDYKKTKLTARIISSDFGLTSFPSQSIRSDSSNGAVSHSDLGGNLFELPLGYGCSRASPSGRQLDYKPPRNCFNTDQPHTCFLEASIWVPPAAPSDSRSENDEDEEELDLDQWRQHVSNMRITSGHLLGRNYVSLEATDFAPAPTMQTELNLDTLEADGQAERWPVNERELRPGSVVMRRAKRIWDLGERAAHVDGASEERDNKGNNLAHRKWKPMHFGLADHLRSCVAFGEAELNELPSVDFELHDFDEIDGKRAKNRTSRTVGLSLIDDEMLADFFEHLDGFELVREDSENWRKFQSVHQEKRVERFQFRDLSGQVNWIGPVSIIRKFYFIDALGKNLASIESAPVEARTDSSQPEVPLEALRVELTLIVLSRMLDRQLARIRLVMSPGLLVDEAHLHRELDIGPCLDAAAVMASNSCRPRWRPPPSASRSQLMGAAAAGLDLTLVYPLEEPFQDSQLDVARSQVYSQFLHCIAGESLLGSNGFKLNVLQVNQIEVDIEPELVRVSCRINKWPHSYDYAQHATTRPSPSSKVRVFLREIKPNAELCARTCSLYQCPLFVFRFTSNSCELYEFLPHLSGSDQPQKLIEFISDLTSDTYERRPGAARPHAEPKFVLARMREAFLDRSGDDQTNELAIRLDLEAGLKVNLLPNAMSVGNEHWHQDKLMLQADQLETANQANASPTRVVIDQDEVNNSKMDNLDWKLEIEFVYLMKFQKFKLDDQIGHSQDFPVAEAKHLSQAECELLCLENDCRSYSYCDLDKSCIVSKIIEESKIKARSEKGDFCKLMAVDQLSKFQATGKNVISSTKLVELINKTIEENKNDVAKLWLRFRFESQRDCAMACLETNEFVCRSFFFCRKNTNKVSGSAEDGDCHLFASRQSGASLTIGLDRGFGQHMRENIGESGDDTCDYYQRSYLVDYHEFHGQRLASDLVRDQRRQVEFRLGLSAEDCAAECSQETLDEQNADGLVRVCRAFEVCFGGTGDESRSKRQQLSCGLLIEDSRAREKSTRQVSSILTDGPKCTAFVRLRTSSRGSTLADAQSGDNELELEPLGPDSRAEGAEGGRGPWPTVAAVSFGLALGYLMSCALVVLARRSRRQVDAVN